LRLVFALWSVLASLVLATFIVHGAGVLRSLGRLVATQIVEEAIELHVRMINEFKGAVGVKPERLQEAFTVKHCALSLVGEPIMSALAA
jgi:hypothetical protein